MAAVNIIHQPSWWSVDSPERYSNSPGHYLTRPVIAHTWCTICRTNKERAESVNIPTRTQYYSQNRKKGDMLYNTLLHGVQSLQATGLQANPTWSLKDRLRAEALWIKRLDTR